MNKKTVLIVDDETLARVSLRNKLERFSGVEVIGEASSVRTASESIERLNPDIIFLDIQLNDGTGFDLLEKVSFSGRVVFITAFDKYAVRAFEVNALDYLLKPVSQRRLKEAVGKVLNDQEEPSSGNLINKVNYDDRIMLNSRKLIFFIRIDQIASIQAAKDYTTVFDTTGRSYLSPRSLNEWESVLPEKNFARIHRSSIINFNHIERTEKSSGSGRVFVTGYPEPLEISRKYMLVMKAKYKF